jgi:uncharacterized protein (DUF433 family)
MGGPNPVMTVSSLGEAMNWRDRIVIDPKIHHGDPCIRGTGVPVSIVVGIVGSVADGDTFEQIIDAWPQLTPEDIKAALRFAAEAVSNVDFIPITASAGDGED